METEVGSNDSTSVTLGCSPSSAQRSPSPASSGSTKPEPRVRVEFAGLKFQDIRLLMTLSPLWPKVNWPKTLVSQSHWKAGELITPTVPTWVPRPELLCRHGPIQTPRACATVQRCRRARGQGAKVAGGEAGKYPRWTLEVPDLATATVVQ